MTWDSRGNNSPGPWYTPGPSPAPPSPEYRSPGPPPPEYRSPGFPPGPPPPGSGPLPPYLRQQPRHTQPRKSRRLVIALTAGALVVVTGLGVGAYTVFKGPSGSTTGFVPTGSTPQEDAQQITTAFLQAWQKGDLHQAAQYTNHPVIAQGALTGYRRYLHLKEFSGTVQGASAAAGTGTRESVRYAISATVATDASPTALSGTWQYHSSLTAYQQPNSQTWYIAWSPNVLGPNLTSSTHLAAVKVAPQVVMVADTSGKDLTSYHDAGLNNIARLLESKGLAAQGSPGLYVEIQNASGQAVQNSQAVVVAPKNIPSAPTPIDSRAEAAAMNAVGMHDRSAMVVIQPSTGKILAIANNAQQNDFALTAAVAPGSTMKVITSAALFNQGIITANSAVTCPPTVTITGITYHNDQNESEPAGTPFINDFAASCNNAFTSQYTHLSGKLASTAHDYFGLNQKWNIGIAGESASYFNAPASATGSELAQEAFGEGSLIASPIAMASVAATVATGTFKQPYLLNGTTQVTATPLPANTDSQLKEMMRAVVTSGTAAGIGFGPGVYAKTGTASIAHQEQPNSWLIAFDPSKDVAVAALVVKAGYGAQFAGPEVKAFLDGF